MDAGQHYLIEVVDQLDDEGEVELAKESLTTTEISLQAFSGALIHGQ